MYEMNNNEINLSKLNNNAMCYWCYAVNDWIARIYINGRNYTHILLYWGYHLMVTYYSNQKQ